MKRGDFCFWEYPLIELAGKTMGIIGFGRIGQAVSRIALAFGMKILAFDPGQQKNTSFDGVEFVNQDELFGKSDVISLHCPLTEETEMNTQHYDLIAIGGGSGGLAVAEKERWSYTDKHLKGTADCRTGSGRWLKCW